MDRPHHPLNPPAKARTLLSVPAPQPRSIPRSTSRSPAPPRGLPAGRSGPPSTVRLTINFLPWLNVHEQRGRPIPRRSARFLGHRLRPLGLKTLLPTPGHTPAAHESLLLHLVIITFPSPLCNPPPDTNFQPHLLEHPAYLDRHLGSLSRQAHSLTPRTGITPTIPRSSSRYGNPTTPDPTSTPLHSQKQAAFPLQK